MIAIKLIVSLTTVYLLYNSILATIYGEGGRCCRVEMGGLCNRCLRLIQMEKSSQGSLSLLRDARNDVSMYVT